MNSLSTYSALMLVVLALAPGLAGAGALAADGDTTVVQTFTFDDITKRSGTFQFPPAGKRYQKILMHYTLKCDARTTADNYPCGEWDYLTYTFVTDSSGVLDSTRFTHPNFIVNGATPDTYAYSAMPTYTVYQRREEALVPDDASGITSYTIGAESGTSSELFAPERHSAKAYFLWRAAELSTAGMAAGPLRGLKLKIAQDNVQPGLLQIRIKHSNLEELGSTIAAESGFQTVYANSAALNNGWNDLYFLNAFNWNGSSNLLIEFSYDNLKNGAAQTANSTTDWTSCAYAVQKNNFLFFEGEDYVEVPVEALEGIGDEITISFWQFGTPEYQPQNDNIFEGRNAAGQRVVNAHLPWGDGTVYWDAGNAGTSGYDRITRAASAQEYEGRWNHWAFTKNAKTGEMKIFLNGELWHSGSGLARTMDRMAWFRIGAGVDRSYDGAIDDFAIWDKALDAATLKAWLYRTPDNSHPNWTNLRVLYRFDEGSGRSAANAVNTDYSATLMGLPQWQDYRGAQIHSNFATGRLRPLLTFIQGELTSHVEETIVADTLENARVSIVLYENPGPNRQIDENDPRHPARPTDTLYVWPAGIYAYTYAPDGSPADSTFIEPTGNLNREDRVYFSGIVRYEIGRYITPYGIGLDLGPKGFTWVFDVTDFAPLLHDWVQLSAHNNQELIDLKFIMIEGTPPRDVLGITKLWDGDFSYKSIIDEERLNPVEVGLHPEAKGWRVKTITSGHQFDNETNCAEFCRREHYLTVNGREHIGWDLWNECGLNPVYPQGGTWPIDRAGWCPGEIVDPYDHEITPYIQAGDKSVTIDYGVETDETGGRYGNWVTRAHLFQYTAPNFQHDAAVVDIVAPNDFDKHSRVNPVCNNPIIIIQNTGANTLRSLTIDYGVQGGGSARYQWSGELDFLEQEVVYLPPFAFQTAGEGKNSFSVSLSAPNGETDEYAANNSSVKSFSLPPVYYNEFEIWLRTNNFANEQYSWELKRDDGTLIDKRSMAQMENNKDYRETYVLEDGCYEFRLRNELGYGLDFWFLRDQLGSGSLRFASKGVVFRTFNPDFGTELYHQFRIGTKPVAQVSADTLDFGRVAIGNKKERTVVINPANAKGLEISGITVSDFRRVFSIRSIEPAPDNEGVIRLAEGESAVVTLEYEPDSDRVNSGTLLATTNDERNPSVRVRLMGLGGDVVSVNEGPLVSAQLTLEASPNPFSAETQIRYSVTAARPVPLKLCVLDAMGRELAVLRNELSAAADYTSTFNGQDLPSGMYYIVLSTPTESASIPVLLVK